MGRGKGVRGKDSYHLDNLDKVDSCRESADFEPDGC